MKNNFVYLKGRLGKDPENINGVVKFSMATSQKYKSKEGEQVEKTQWHNCVAFKKTGEIIEKFFKKGDEIIIEGAIEYNEHEGKYYTSIKVASFDFCGSNGKGSKDIQVNDPEIHGPEPEDLLF